MTSRGPLTLAALASAAVPGLDPDTVQGVVPSGPADAVEVAFIQDREHRRWVIRCPRTPAASAQLERSAALLAVLARRLTMPVPAVKGWVALPEGGRAAVHSYLTGRLVGLEGIEPGTALARGLGRALAHLHNLDPGTYEEAGVPAYDAAGYRSRRLAELDRAAATGRVPTGLLARWERVLDDPALWDFSATPTHGDLGEGTILATPDDGQVPDVKALLGWESAQVADPADDIAPLLAVMDAEAFDTVMEAYAHTRVERPDRHLHRRAQVIGEMQLVRTMMMLVAAGDDAGAEESAARLRRLDEKIARDEDEAARIHDTAATRTTAGATGAGESTGAGGPTAGTAGDAADEAAGSADTQPVATDRTSGSTSEDGDAVEVEHPAQVTPVTPVDPVDPAADDADVPQEDAAAEATRDRTEPGTAPGLRSVPNREQDPDTDPDTKPNPEQEQDTDAETEQAAAGGPGQPRGDDHETAEIVPINDDGDDDVVPPQR